MDERRDSHLVIVCRAIFVDQAEEPMRHAWRVFVQQGQEALDAAEFRQVLPLLGEDVPEAKVRIPEE